MTFAKFYYFTDVFGILQKKKKQVRHRHRDGSSIRSGYPEPLLKGIDLGIKKFIPTSEAPLYSIIYNQFLAQKISTMIDREQSFFSIYFFALNEVGNIKLNYKISYKVFLLKYCTLIYIAILKLRNFFR
ncbi:Uncharacterised protein [Acinetobacter baumannii]|nr:Uncharacterised protein [Acinetobacter baumannii]